MTDRITAQFTLTQKEMAEGIAIASNALLLPWQRRASWFLTLVLGLLAGAGGMGIFMAVYKNMLGIPPPFYLGPLVFLVVGSMALVHPGMVLDWMSKRALAVEDPTGTHMEIDATALHIRATHEDRRLEWPAVHTLTQGEKAIFLSISGAAIILPNRVLDDPKAAFAQLQTWHKAAL